MGHSKQNVAAHCSGILRGGARLLDFRQEVRRLPLRGTPSRPRVVDRLDQPFNGFRPDFVLDGALLTV